MIEALHLTKRFQGGRVALDDVSVKVGRAESYCLLGGPAAGKSVFVDIFRAAIRPTSGSGLVNGVDCIAHPVDVRRQALFVTPGSSLVPHISIRANVDLFCRVAGAGQFATRDAIENALRRAGLPENSFDALPQQIERKEAPLLAWLAIAQLRKVTSIFLDEPTLGLDERGIEWAVESIREMGAAGTTFLIATSDATVARATASRIGVLRAGGHVAEYAAREMTGEQLTAAYFHGLGHPSDSPNRP